MASARPYRFTGLRRYTQQELDLEQSLRGFLCSNVFSAEFSRELAADLGKYLKAEVKFGDVQTSVVHKDEIYQLVPQNGCFLVIGAGPGPEKILVDLDSSLASCFIDKLLGGTGEVGRIQRPLTQIEQGVLSFVILNVLDNLHNGIQSGTELALCLDRFANRPGDLAEVIDQSDSYCSVGIRLAIGKRVGYVRVLLPQALISSHFRAPPEQSDGELDTIRQRLRCMGNASFRGRIEVATIDLTDEDLGALEDGDIIVLDNHRLRLGSGGILGEANVRFGLGENGMVQGQLVNEGEVSRLEITSIIVQEQPAEEVMDDSDDGSVVVDVDDIIEEGSDLSAVSQDNLGQTEGLLRDINAPVVIELGRIKMNTAQVTRLREGQVLRLPRGPNDPVNLVVHGKLFAKGELIEVDGEMGVRILKLAR